MQIIQMVFLFTFDLLKTETLIQLLKYKLNRYLKNVYPEAPIPIDFFHVGNVSFKSFFSFSFC